MSGRLTILPKKTYCPWKPENVERVLRDERLERERIEREKKFNNNRRGASSSSSSVQQNAHTTDNGHVNLFPEAKEAELRLANGGGAAKNETASHKNASNDTLSGVLPIPLGGDESTNRKLGNVPFYMNATTTDKEEAGEKYNNTNGSFRLGNNRIAKSGQSCSTSDEITNKIMKDQYIKREDHRKFSMDPMKRFYVKEEEQHGRSSINDDTTSFKDIYTSRYSGVNHASISNYTRKDSGTCVDDINVDNNMNRHTRKGNNVNDDESQDNKKRKKKKHHKKHRKKKKRKKKSYKSYGKDGNSSDDSSSSSSSSSSDGDEERYSRKRRRRKHSRNHRESRDKRNHNIHDTTDNNSQQQSRAVNNNNDDLEELRIKRRVREAEEMERERQLVQHRY